MFGGGKDVSIVIRAVDKATATIKGITAAFQKLGVVGKLTTAAAVAFVGRELLKCARAGLEAEKVTVRLGSAFGLLGINAKAATADMQVFADELKKSVAIDDEEILAAAEALATVGLSGDLLKRTLPVIADLAKKLGISMPAAAQAFERSLIGGRSELTRWGITSSAAVGSMERYEQLTTKAIAVSGGFASELRNSTGGAVDRARIAIDDLREAIGKLILMPIGEGAQAIDKLNEEKFRRQVAFESRLRKENSKWLKTKNNDLRINFEQLAAAHRAERELYEARAKYLEKMEQDEKDSAERKRKEAADKIRKEQEDVEEIARLQAGRALAEKSGKISAEEAALKEAADATAKADAEIWKARQDAAAAGAAKITDILEGNLKGVLRGELRAWAEKEIAKMIMAGPGTFGASLAGIPVIAGALAAGNAAINAVPFAQGGSFIARSGGGYAQVGERGPERVTVEPLASGRERPTVVQIKLDSRVLGEALIGYQGRRGSGRA